MSTSAYKQNEEKYNIFKFIQFKLEYYFSFIVHFISLYLISNFKMFSGYNTSSAWRKRSVIVSVRVIIMRTALMLLNNEYLTGHFVIKKIKIHTIPISGADMDNFLEGDIQKTPNLMRMLRRANLMKRDAVARKTWRYGIVPYRFDKGFGKNNGNNLNPSNDRAFVWISLSVSFFSFLSSFLSFY